MTSEVTPTPKHEQEKEPVVESKLPPANLKRRFTIEAEAILGADIETMVAMADKTKLAPTNVINEESSMSSSRMSSSNRSS